MISFITVYVPRYGLPVDLLALFAILAAVIGVFETQRNVSPNATAQ